MTNYEQMFYLAAKSRVIEIAWEDRTSFFVLAKFTGTSDQSYSTYAY